MPSSSPSRLTSAAGNCAVRSRSAAAGAGGAGAATDRAAAGSLKPVWHVPPREWSAPEAQGEPFLRRAVQMKTVWLPYGALPAGAGGGAY